MLLEASRIAAARGGGANAAGRSAPESCAGRRWAARDASSSPKIFHRIEFRGIGGQPREGESAARRVAKGGDQPLPRRRPAVADHQQFARQLAPSMAEEVITCGARLVPG
jgi:hypothetical protein